MVRTSDSKNICNRNSIFSTSIISTFWFLWTFYLNNWKNQQKIMFQKIRACLDQRKYLSGNVVQISSKSSKFYDLFSDFLKIIFGYVFQNLWIFFSIFCFFSFRLFLNNLPLFRIFIFRSLFRIHYTTCIQVFTEKKFQ